MPTSRCSSAPATAAATGRTQTQTHRPTSHRRVAECGRSVAGGAPAGRGKGGGRLPLFSQTPALSACLLAHSRAPPPPTSHFTQPLPPVPGTWQAWPAPGAITHASPPPPPHPPRPPRPRRRSFPAPLLSATSAGWARLACASAKKRPTQLRAACCSDALKRALARKEKRVPGNYSKGTPEAALQGAHNGTLEGA